MGSKELGSLRALLPPLWQAVLVSGKLLVFSWRSVDNKPTYEPQMVAVHQDDGQGRPQYYKYKKSVMERPAFSPCLLIVALENAVHWLFPLLDSFQFSVLVKVTLRL